MTDRPILFSAPMVRAILEGRKTQTRRIFKPRGFDFYTHPISGDRYDEYQPYRDGTWDESRIIGSGSMAAFGWGEGLYSYLPCYPGDRLWVKETWRSTPAYDDLAPSKMGGDEPLNYLADDGYFNWAEADGGKHGKTRVSIHMPRWASRLTLTVTDVRVERLQDISEADAVAEGIPADYLEHIHGPHGFRDLWDSINGKREGASWEANPWVVAISFDAEQRNIDQ